jgi:group I intron endonuclease
MKRVPDKLAQTGVYAIINKINHKFYIGSASQSNKKNSASGFYARRKLHFSHLNNNKHSNRYLQRSWNKYGQANFEFYILHVCPPEECLQFEQLYLNLLCPHYNICKTAGNTLGQKHSEELSLKRSKDYIFISPEGKVHEGKNVRKFCRDYKLNQPSIQKIHSGEALHYHGWTTSIEAHTLYRDCYLNRGINKEKKSWRVWVVKGSEKKRKNFKTKEEAINFRDSIEKEGHTFKVNCRDWKEKLLELQQQNNLPEPNDV